MNIKSTVKKVRNSEDGRRLAENFVSLTLLQICGYVFPIMTFPYLTRVLGVELFGAVSFAMAVVWGLQTVVDWGFNLVSARDVAQVRDNHVEVSRILSVTLCSKMILLIFSALILCVLCVSVPVFREKTMLLWYAFLMLPGHILFPDWFFQGIERMKFITILNFVVKAVFTVSVFVVIRKPEDYVWQPLLNSIGFIIAGMFAMYLIVIKWKYTIKLMHIKDCMHYIRTTSDVFINTLMPNFYNSFAVMLLGFWGGDVANGILEGGAKFANITSNFLQIINRTFFPFLARKKDKHGMFARFNLACSAIVCIALFLLAGPLVRTFLSHEFADSVIVLRICALSVFFVTLSTTYGANYLIISHNERFCRNITVVASLIAFAVSLPLIYYWTWLGAAFTMFIGRFLMGMGMYMGARYVKGK